MKKLLFNIFILLLVSLFYTKSINAQIITNASGIQPSQWASPGSIGSTTPNTGAFSALTVGGNSIIASGHGFIPFATGQLAAIVASGQYFAGETPVALSLQNFVATAAALTCTTNPTLTLEDCGTSAGTCASPTALASVTLTAANTITSSATTFPVAVAQGHFLAVETTAGACTILNATGSAAY